MTMMQVVIIIATAMDLVSWNRNWNLSIQYRNKTQTNDHTTGHRTSNYFILILCSLYKTCCPKSQINWPAPTPGTKLASLAAGRSMGIARLANIKSVKVMHCEHTVEPSAIIGGLQFVKGNYRNRKSSQTEQLQRLNRTETVWERNDPCQRRELHVLIARAINHVITRVLLHTQLYNCAVRLVVFLALCVRCHVFFETQFWPSYLALVSFVTPLWHLFDIVVIPHSLSRKHLCETSLSFPKPLPIRCDQELT